MPFPKEIDNTIREAFVVCPTKCKRAYFDDLAPVQPSAHLHAGGALAAGLEATRRAYFERGLSAADSLAIGDEALVTFWGDFDPPAMSFKTLANMREALHYYFDVWPLGTDPLTPLDIEWRFRIPIPGLVHPDDGGPIYAVGRSDAPGDLGGMYTIEDDKTASSLGASWAAQWDLDSQFTQYVWAAQQEGKMPRDGTGPVLIRGLSILSPKYNEVPDPNGDIVRMTGRGKNKINSTFKLEYDRASSFGHSQALVYRPQWMVDRWLHQFTRDVRRMLYAYMNNEWDLALHKNACAAYGGCPFKLLCMSREPDEWIAVNYTHRKWNPLAAV